MAKSKRCLPGIAKWNRYASSFDIRGAFGEYHIGSIGDGRRRRYQATFANTKGASKLSRGLWSWLAADGTAQHVPLTAFRSPAAAASAANKHCTLVGQGLAGPRKRRRR